MHEHRQGGLQFMRSKLLSEGYNGEPNRPALPMGLMPGSLAALAMPTPRHH